MKILASCMECNAPQRIFNSEMELEKGIQEKKECWYCNNSFISVTTTDIINLNTFSDPEEIKNESLIFWQDDWEKKYRKWMKVERKFEITDGIENHYEQVSNRIKDKFEESQFWTELSENLSEFHGEYKEYNEDYNLFLELVPPELDVKSFNSFFLKTFRKNILNNKNLIEEPENGWIVPDNWYSQIGDVIRTLFVVKYLDGVKFMAEKIESICKKHNIKYKTSYEAKDEGYYAAHISILQEFVIPKFTWDSTKINVWIEIQITTQLQEVIRNLLHKYYEENRKKMENKDVKWQWEYKNEEFSMNYLGHILYYIEGMIMDIRNKQEVKENGK